MHSDLIARSEPVKVDVAIIADIRVGDVAAPCHAAAAAALSDAGYSIAIVPVITGAIPADPYRVDADMQNVLRTGAVRRVGTGAMIECSLALAFDARLFAAPLESLPQICAQHRIVTVERPSALASLGRADLDLMRERAQIALGGPVIWSPTSITARDAMAFAAPDWPITEENWAPVAPDLSHVRSDAAERARPAVGRARIARARRSAQWPARLLSTSLVALRDRSAALENPELWPQAAPIEKWSDETVTMAAFLSKLDLLANPDRAEDDPLPVEALMALSAGVVPCLPESYRAVFGGAALYGEAGQLSRAIIKAKIHQNLMAAARRAGTALLREVFSADLFVKRIRALIGPAAVTSFAPCVHATPNTRVLFYSTNGIGMGHLTRQLAIARRLPERIQPVFVSHSRAVDTVRRFGFISEHLPYHATYGEVKAHWNVGLAAALEATFAFYKPEVVIFDGNVPFIGLLKALSQRPGIASVWVRRAMWGARRDTQALERAAAFDLVIEPLDPAWSHDAGPTVDFKAEVRTVPPVRILDQSEIPNREDACAALELNPANTNVLVATGSGNNFDIASITSRVVEQLKGRKGLGLAVAEWQIAQARQELPEGIIRLKGYPFSQYLSAFDMAVAAPGYNTFCEHLAAGLPTLWVPNEHVQMDQQIDRARYAVDQRCGLMVRRDAPFDVAAALSKLLDPSARQAMANAGARLAAQHMTQNGAGEIAKIVADLAVSSIARLSFQDEATDTEDTNPDPPHEPLLEPQSAPVV